jgi:two-component system, OmpR family, sensor histidine kinase BaeS
MSLRTKLILAFSIVVTALVLFLVLFINRDNSRQVQNYMMRGGMLGYDNVVIQVENYYQVNNSWDGIATLANTLQPGTMGMMGGKNGPRAQFTITDAALKVVWSSAGEQVGSTLAKDVKDNAVELKAADNTVIGYLLVSGKRALQPAEVSPLLNNLKTAVLRSGLIAGLLAIIIATIVANGLIRPVKLLTQAADSLAHGKLSTRVDLKGEDEISHLGNSFNVMAENLEAAETRKKALTADIAHELRSPLAVQKAQLEAMQDGIVPINQESLQTVVDQTNFLTRLVDDLRTLALVDAGELPLQIEDVELIKLSIQVVERFQLQAAQQEIMLLYTNSTNSEEIHIHADPDRLTQIIGNLVTNALQHTGPGGYISVDVTKTKDTVSVAVKDNGRGIDEKDLPHLFERFYRGDKSRCRENSSSTGLGLSIARNLARVHGGELTAENNHDFGAKFILTLPLK